MKMPLKKITKPVLQKRQTLELSVSALDEDGYGIGIAETCQIRVRGALPGERVVVRVEHAGQHKVVADLVKIIEPADNRRKSPCSHLPECDGCPLIAMEYSSPTPVERDPRQQPYPPLQGTGPDSYPSGASRLPVSFTTETAPSLSSVAVLPSR